MLHGGDDEREQNSKWQREHKERKVRKEPSLNEFLKAFDMMPSDSVPVERNNKTHAVLSPILDGVRRRHQTHYRHVPCLKPRVHVLSCVLRAAA